MMSRGLSEQSRRKKFSKWAKVKASKKEFPDSKLYTICENGEVDPDTFGLRCGTCFREKEEDEFRRCMVSNCYSWLEPDYNVCLLCIYRYRFYIEPLEGEKYVKTTSTCEGGQTFYLYRRNCKPHMFEPFITKWNIPKYDWTRRID